MNPEEMNISLNELSHHGILGMKWGIRRFQKYPAGYSGDGKYVGPNGQPRQPTRKEARRDRKYNELKTKIDKWTRDAVANGDKKALKALKKTMSPQEYQEKYDTIVKTGVAKAVKAGDKEALKKFKNDLSPNEMKDARTMAAFTDAINRFDEKRINALISKVKNEDLKEAATRIAAMNDLQEKRISALKMESEASIKLAKVAKTAKDIGSIAKSAGEVYKFINDVKSGGNSDNNQNQQQNNNQKSQNQQPQTQKQQQNNNQKPQTQKQNDSSTSNKNQNGSKEASEIKQKFKELSERIDEQFNNNKTVGWEALNAQRAYSKLSHPSQHSSEELKNAERVVKEFEASGSKLKDIQISNTILEESVKRNNTEINEMIKTGATNAIKENLDRIFSSVDEDNPNYYYYGKRVYPGKN